jgi:hypothetical protein
MFVIIQKRVMVAWILALGYPYNYAELWKKTGSASGLRKETNREVQAVWLTENCATKTL